MRDPVTGEFRPQSSDYLNTVPGPALAKAFLDAVRQHSVVKMITSDGDSLKVPKVVYLQAQRWGSGLPAPEHIASDIQEIYGTRYAATLTSSLVNDASDDTIRTNDFVADDALGLYYAGDFCSHRNPGLEAAALSGLNLAKHIVEKSKPQRHQVYFKI